MKEYNENKPLIMIHIPKTAGITVKEIYEEWYRDRLLLHYHGNEMPEKYNIADNHSSGYPFCIYGHFNRKRNFGIEQYYPDVDQFVTVLRDPFEQAISGFFYVRNTNPCWREQLNLPEGGVSEYISGLQSGILDYFPHVVTEENYQEMFDKYFVEVGLVEYLDESMKRIAAKLNKKYVLGSLKKLNVAKRDQDIPYHLKDSFIERHKLEYDVYNYVLKRYK